MPDSRRFGYTYKGSALAAQKPLTIDQIIDQVERTLNSPAVAKEVTVDDFQVYELVPRKLKTLTRGIKVELI